MKNGKPYVIRSGDYLSLLATLRGFDAETAWNDEKNANLRTLRNDDMNLLAPGDLVFVPEPEVAPQALQSGTQNDYEAKVPTVAFRVQFVVSGNVLAKKEFEPDPGIDPPPDKTTDADGYATLSVPINMPDIRVKFPTENLEFCIHVGLLNPPETRSGQAQRLTALGYYAQLPFLESKLGDNEIADLAVARAVAAFQENTGLPITGDADAETLQRIVAAFGS